MFAHDTEVALRAASALVNSAERGGTPLDTTADLARFLDEHEWTGSRAGTTDELRAVLDLRGTLRGLWSAGEQELVESVNRLLREGNALPQLVRHDHWDWHLHATPSQAPLATRMAVEAAMAFVDVIRMGETARLRHCAAPDCGAVFVDFSRNRSKRFCDLGNCGNRTNVAAYRERAKQGG